MGLRRFSEATSGIGSVIGLLALLLFAGTVRGQSGTGTVRGQVTDPSGASVQNATIQVTGASGRPATTQSGRDGTYEVKGLAPGTYTVKADAKGFEQYQSSEVQVSAGQIQKVDLPLSIEVEEQKVEVTEQSGTQLSVSPDNNAGAIVLSGKDLDQLSDDPDELQSDLEALAGPSVGPNGGQMYIDGFTAGQLPPKSSIREIRINQNPFSAEYDKLGYGRIEIFTKPGTDQFHGQFMILGNDSAFNSRSPFLGTATLPGYDTTQFNGSFGGPLNKKASFFIDAQRRDINSVEVVNAQTQPGVLFTQGAPNPRTRTNVGPRLDYQLSTNNTLTVRYQYYRDNETNDGVGQYALPSQGYNLLNTEQTLQVSDTQIFGASVVNETRVQYLHDGDNQTPQNTAPTIIVPYEFTGGGNNLGRIVDTQNHYELQNYTSIAFGTHLLKFGARLRDVDEENSSTANYNGTFTFPTLAAYEANTPVQFSVTTGNPSASSNLFDAGLYIQDDWRWKPNVTISSGLRFETQDHISNHVDLAPRFGLAWGIGRGKTQTPKTVLRAGWGMFYDRFTNDLVLQAERQNGITQQEYIVADPTFYPTIPPVGTLQSSQSGVPTIYRIAPNLHAPYTMQTALTVERQVSRVVNLTVSYVNSRGVHELLTDNVNAPLPGTYVIGVPTSGVRPNGIFENIYQYESPGLFRQNQLITNVNIRMGARLSLSGYYALNYARSDTAGPTSFPSDPYHIGADYGRASFDVRNRLFFGGSISLPRGFRLNPFMVFNSGTPFNVTTPLDLNGDSIFNDRPALVSAATCPGVVSTATPNVLCTQLGTFNTIPSSGQQIIPINNYTGPDLFTFNLRLSKAFGFGARKESADQNAAGGGPGRPGGFGRGIGGPGGGGRGGGGGGRFGGPAAGNQRYTLTFSVNARNLFNIVNDSTPAGSLGSKNFDTPNALAGGAFGNGAAVRQIQLQAQFSF
ncbi:MAG: carboxypeptidase regulatory-like domain-containing protein [Candidatus Acidiferrales bacterium]